MAGLVNVRRGPVPKQGRTARALDPIEVPEFVRQGIRDGLTPYEIERRGGTLAAIYLEEARQQGELDAYEATAANVEMLRKRNLRWERIAARVFGDPRKKQEAKDLYNEAKGREGAAQESYTGRGRRYSKMDP
jgi:hypothetical protein